MQTRSWDDKESGQKKYRTEILVNELTLLGGRPGGERRLAYSNGEGYSRGTQGGYGQTRPAAKDDYTDQGITDDDIPF
ncbi:MAG: hypothetical protein ABI380_14875 [Edaphobacter sp.]